MKKYLFATAFAAAALVSTSALAEVSGHAGLSYTTNEVETPLGDFDADGFTLGGALFAPVSETFGLQFDAAANDSDSSDLTLSGAAHAIVNVGAGRIGGFVSAADLGDDTLWGVGAEGQFAVAEQFTLAGTLAYAKVDDVDVDLVGAAGELRYFPMDNLRLSTTLGYVDIQDVDVSAWTWGANAEYQLPATPVSLFGGYNRTEADDVDVVIDGFTFGVRYNFGGQTLKGRDRDGASMLGLGAITGIAAAF